MSHDPLCGYAPESFSRGVIGNPCRCDLIARVREDERDEAQRLLIRHGAQQFTIGERMGRAFGREAALRDAVEAVKARGGYHSAAEFAAAIQALGGER